MKDRILNIVLTIVAFVAVMVLCSEKAEGYSWAYYYTVQGIAAVVAIVTGRALSRRLKEDE